MEEIHVDQSTKYHQAKDNQPSVVGYQDKYNELLKGAIILPKTQIKRLETDFNIDNIQKIQYELHAAVLYLLLRDRVLKYAKEIILCEDYDFIKTMNNLSYLLPEEALGKFRSILTYRKRIGIAPRQQSLANGFVGRLASAYKKAKNIHRRKEIVSYGQVLDYNTLKYTIQVIHKKQKIVGVETNCSDNSLKKISLIYNNL